MQYNILVLHWYHGGEDAGGRTLGPCPLGGWGATPERRRAQWQQAEQARGIGLFLLIIGSVWSLLVVPTGTKDRDI